MSRQRIRIRELAGWDLDNYEHRPDSFDRCKHSDARRAVGQRAPFEAANAVVESRNAVVESAMLDNSLAVSLAKQAARLDLHAEMAGLDWSLGVVDLRLLLAFQRRLASDPDFAEIPAPAAGDWSALTALSFGPAKPVVCELIRGKETVVLQSSNPNLHFRISAVASTPVTVHAGSPFFEVAEYRGRWFLRDGYHRAYTLLQAGIFELPAVIVQAATLEELGAGRPWFFPEEILFSSSPPRVTDFLDDALILEYDRPSLIKTLRVTMEETLAPAAPSGETP